MAIRQWTDEEIERVQAAAAQIYDICEAANIDLSGDPDNEYQLMIGVKEPITDPRFQVVAPMYRNLTYAAFVDLKNNADPEVLHVAEAVAR